MVQESEGEDSEGDSDRGEVDDKEGFVVFSCEFIDIDAIDPIQYSNLHMVGTPPRVLLFKFKRTAPTDPHPKEKALGSSPWAALLGLGQWLVALARAKLRKQQSKIR